MATLFTGLNAACVSLFGTAVSYQKGAAEPFTVKAIIRRVGEEERHQGGRYLKLFVDLADFTTHPDHGDVVQIDSATYRVTEVLKDAAGGADLTIRED